MSVVRRDSVDLDASVCVDDLTQISESSVIVVEGSDRSAESMKESVVDDVEGERVEFLAYEENGNSSMRMFVYDVGSPKVIINVHESMEEQDEVDAAVREIEGACVSAVVSDGECEVVKDAQSQVGIGVGSISYGYHQVQYNLNQKYRHFKNEHKKIKNLRRIIKNKNKLIKQLHKKLVDRSYSKPVICRRVKDLNLEVEQLKLANKNNVSDLIAQMSKIIEQNQILQNKYFQLNNDFLKVTQNPRNTLIHARLDPDTFKIIDSKQVYVEADCRDVRTPCFEGDGVVCLHFVVKHVGKIAVNMNPPF